jgi:hypothetical protein
MITHSEFRTQNFTCIMWQERETKIGGEEDSDDEHGMGDINRAN